MIQNQDLKDRLGRLGVGDPYHKHRHHRPFYRRIYRALSTNNQEDQWLYWEHQQKAKFW